MVEDDPGHAGLVKSNLEEAGIVNEVIRFDNGEDAINALFNNEHNIRPSFALILLDINLPGMDGYEVLETLRSNPLTKLTPVCILTTTSDEREIQRCYELGCNVYVTKPIEYGEFQEAMKKLGIFFSLIKMPKTK